MSNPTPSPSGTPVASSPQSPPPTTTTAPSQTPPSTPPSTTTPASSQTPPAPPPSVSPPPPPLSSPPPPPVSASAPAPSSPSTAASSPPPPSSVASPPPPKSSTPSPPSTASSPPPPASSVASPPPPKSSTPSPPPTATSPPPPPSSVAPPPPPKSSTPSSSTSPPPPPAVKSNTNTPSTSTSSPPSPASSISGSSVIAIGVSGVLAISVIAVLLYCLCKKKKKKKYYPGDYYGPPGGPPSHYKDSYDRPNMRQQEWCSPSSNGSDVLIKIPPPPVPPSLPSSRNGYDPIPPALDSGGSPGLGNSKSWFTYGELATATGGFSKSNMLGEGGFGCVYKGVLTDGQLVAVKQLKVGASQGEKEFQAEVEIISRVHHRHLVSLVGYCIAESQRLLVYDYVPNGTLEYHLHKKKGPVMDWAARIKIACGAARGLAYLHEDCHPRIIHRDIKSSNILLDSNFEAQVSDFGLAKLTSDTNTHVTTRVMGTFGYLAPEYASSGKLTDKSDVFSFGVVLLELLTGRKPVDSSQPLGEESLVEWARPVLAQVNSEEDLEILADPSLNGVYDPKEMMQMVEAAAACVRHSANKRPRMGQVVRALEDDTSLSDLNKGLKPGHSSMYGSSFTSTDYDNASYSADMRRFRRVALESQEYSSGATSEYGVNPSVSSSEYQTSREIDRNLSQLTKPMTVRKNTLSSNSNEFLTRN